MLDFMEALILQLIGRGDRHRRPVSWQIRPVRSLRDDALKPMLRRRSAKASPSPPSCSL
jgi:hypothetical protein